MDVRTRMLAFQSLEGLFEVLTLDIRPNDPGCLQGHAAQNFLFGLFMFLIIVV